MIARPRAKGQGIATAASPRDLLAIPQISLLWGMNWPTLGLALRGWADEACAPPCSDREDVVTAEG